MARSEKSKQRNREYTAAYNKRNPERVKLRLAEWRQRNKVKLSELHLLRKYGMTLAQKEDLLAAQGGKCAVCGATDPGSRTRAVVGINRWHVDHNHSTGKVRGILCGDCNSGLGGFRDNVVALRNAVAYLELAHGDQ